ncbi:3-methyladenine DNA glycosylase [uncultured Ornithinimicrobium sp.]|uniref:3-methyladenine DNA glycosylase n=1 Tax=uncultured Ornithinimicrobium sp. TaxID=259307 RepID=UPI00259326A1|nr:3-methyladenine DNA glycosylase [uncultured Ornithinimicrobium sp.]
MQILPEQVWRRRAAEHAAAVEQLTADRLARRVAGRRHPVDDFLWEYYAFRPAQLARWHPGPGVALEGADDRAGWTSYAEADGTAYLDVPAFLARRGRTVEFVRDLVSATLSRPGRFGCFGLHEWAMVYRAGEEELRHQGWPLRLGREGTDAVVESHTVTCSHHDAFRFFTPEAAGRNTLRPTREGQRDLEQPGCLHAAMDVYKWCFKLAPAVPSELTLDAFRLARDVRELDMRAAPYDLRELGYAPVRIETAEGKAEYVSAQRAFTTCSNALRRRLLAVLDALAEDGTREPLAAPGSAQTSW